MKIQLLNEQHNKAWFLVSGAQLSFLNALRRAVIADLPGFAIDEDVEALGGDLKLPSWEEPHRRSIEANLAPVTYR